MKAAYVGLGISSILAVCAQAQIDKADRYRTMLLGKPENPVLFTRFLDAWLESGEMAGLGKFLEDKAAAGGSADWRVLAVFRLHSGDEAAAVAALEQALKAAPDDPGTRLARAKVLATTLRLEESLADLDVASKDPALAMEAGTLRGKILARAGRPEEAVKAWQTVIAANPLDEGLKEDLIELELGEGMREAAAAAARELAAGTKDPYKKALRRLRVAEILAEGGRKEEAVAEYREVFAVSAEDSWLEREVIARVTGMYGKESDVAGARKFLDALRTEHPRRVAVKKESARLLMASGDSEGAVAAFREVLKILPGDRETREEFIALLESAENYREASAEVSVLLAVAATDGPLWEKQASLLKKTGDMAGAGNAVAKAAALVPAGETGAVSAALIYERAGYPEDAEKRMRAAVASHGAGGEAGEALAGLLVRVGKTEEAVALWRDMARTADREGLLKIARTLSASGRAADAYAVLVARQAEMRDDVLFMAALCQTAPLADKSADAVPVAVDLVRQAKTPADLETALAQASALILRTGQADAWIKSLGGLASPTTQDLCLLAELQEVGGDSLGAATTLKRATAGEDGLLAAALRVRILEIRGDLRAAVAATREWIAMPGGARPAQVRRLVELLERSGDLRSALAETENWKRIAPGDKLAWQKRASLLLADGGPELAVAEFRRIISKFGPDDDTRGKLAESQVAAGMTGEAWRSYLTLHDEADSATARIRWAGELGKLAAREGREEELVTELRRRARENPASADALLSLAAIFREWQNAEEELAALAEAYRRKPADVALLLQLSELEERIGSPERAEELLLSAARPGNNPEIRRRLVALHARTGNTEGLRELASIPGSVDPRDGEALARSIAAAKQWEVALAVLEKEIATHPADWRLGYFHALALFNTGAKAAAFDRFKSLLEADGDLAGVSLPPVTADAGGQDSRDAVASMPALLYVAAMRQNGDLSGGDVIRRNNINAILLGAQEIKLPDSPAEARQLALAELLAMAQAEEPARREAMMAGIVSGKIPDLDFIKSVAGMEPGEIQSRMERGAVDRRSFRWLIARINSGANQEFQWNPVVLRRGVDALWEADLPLALELLSAIPQSEKGDLAEEDASRFCDGVAKLEPSQREVFINQLLGLSVAGQELIREETRKRAESLSMEIIGSVKSQVAGYSEWLPIWWLQQGRFDEAVELLNKQYKSRKAVPGGQGNAVALLFHPGNGEDRLAETIGRDIPEAVRSGFMQMEQMAKIAGPQQELAKMLELKDDPGWWGAVKPTDRDRLAAVVPRIEDPLLRMHVWIHLGRREEIGGEIKASEERAITDPRLRRAVVTYYQMEAPDLPKAYSLLVRAREQSQSQADGEELDVSLVSVGLALAKDGTVPVDLEPSRRAALRLRKKVATEQAYIAPFAEVMRGLGLAAESDRFAAGPPRPAVGSSRSTSRYNFPRRDLGSAEKAQAITMAMALEGKKIPAARRILSEIYRIENDTSTGRSRKDVLEFATQLKIQGELLEAAKAAADGSPARKKSYAMILGALGKKDESLAILRQLAVDLPKDAEVGSSLLGALPPEERSEWLGKIASDPGGEEKLALWLGGIQDLDDLGVDEVLGIIEGVAGFLEAVAPEASPKRNLSWVNHQAVDLFEMEGPESLRLRPLWNAAGQSVKLQDYDEDISTRRFGLARRLFMAMIRHPQTCEQGFILLHAAEDNIGIQVEDLDLAAIAALRSAARKVPADPANRWNLVSRNHEYSRGGSGPPVIEVLPDEHLARAIAEGRPLLPYDDAFLKELLAVDPARAAVLGEAVAVARSEGLGAFEEWKKKQRSSKELSEGLAWLVKVGRMSHREDLLDAIGPLLADIYAKQMVPAGYSNFKEDPALVEAMALTVAGRKDLSAREREISETVSRLLGPPETWPLFASISDTWALRPEVGARIQSFILYRRSLAAYRVANVAMLRFLAGTQLGKLAGISDLDELAGRARLGTDEIIRSLLQAGMFHEGPSLVLPVGEDGSKTLLQMLADLADDKEDGSAAAAVLANAEGADLFWATLLAARFSRDGTAVMEELEREQEAISRWPGPARAALGKLVNSWFPREVRHASGAMRKLLDNTQEQETAESRQQSEAFLNNGVLPGTDPGEIGVKAASLIARLATDADLAVKIWLKALGIAEKGVAVGFVSKAEVAADLNSEILDHLEEEGIPLTTRAHLLAKLYAQRLLGPFDASSFELDSADLKPAEAEFPPERLPASLQGMARNFAGYVLSIADATAPDDKGVMAGLLGLQVEGLPKDDKVLGDIAGWAKGRLAVDYPEISRTVLFATRMRRAIQNSTPNQDLLREALVAVAGDGGIPAELRLMIIGQYFDGWLGGRLFRDPAVAGSLADLWAGYIGSAGDLLPPDIVDSIQALATSQGLDKEAAVKLLNALKRCTPSFYSSIARRRQAAEFAEVRFGLALKAGDMAVAGEEITRNEPEFRGRLGALVGLWQMGGADLARKLIARPGEYHRGIYLMYRIDDKSRQPVPPFSKAIESDLAGWLAGITDAGQRYRIECIISSARDASGDDAPSVPHRQRIASLVKRFPAEAPKTVASRNECLLALGEEVLEITPLLEEFRGATRGVDYGALLLNRQGMDESADDGSMVFEGLIRRTLKMDIEEAGNGSLLLTHVRALAARRAGEAVRQISGSLSGLAQYYTPYYILRMAELPPERIREETPKAMEMATILLSFKNRDSNTAGVALAIACNALNGTGGDVDAWLAGLPADARSNYEEMRRYNLRWVFNGFKSKDATSAPVERHQRLLKAIVNDPGTFNREIKVIKDISNILESGGFTAEQMVTVLDGLPENHPRRAAFLTQRAGLLGFWLNRKDEAIAGYDRAEAAAGGNPDQVAFVRAHRVFYVGDKLGNKARAKELALAVEVERLPEMEQGRIKPLLAGNEKK